VNARAQDGPPAGAQDLVDQHQGAAAASARRATAGLKAAREAAREAAARANQAQAHPHRRMGRPRSRAPARPSAPRPRAIPRQLTPLKNADVDAGVVASRRAQVPVRPVPIPRHRRQGLGVTVILATTDSVLEIGAGSGYLTACIGRLAQRVEALEIVPELAELATARLTEHGVANAHVRVQDAEATWDARDAYEAILIGGSVPVVPEYYKNKLAIDGRLIAVVGTTAKPTMEAIRLVRVTETEWLTESLFETCLPPLSSGAPEAPRFVF